MRIFKEIYKDRYTFYKVLAALHLHVIKEDLFAGLQVLQQCHLRPTKVDVL